MAEPSKAADEMKPKANINIWKYLARTHSQRAFHSCAFLIFLESPGGLNVHAHKQRQSPARQHTNRAYILLLSLAAAADSLRAATAQRTEGMTHLCRKLLPVEPEGWKRRGGKGVCVRGPRAPPRDRRCTVTCCGGGAAGGAEGSPAAACPPRLLGLSHKSQECGGRH